MKKTIALNDIRPSFTKFDIDSSSSRSMTPPAVTIGNFGPPTASADPQQTWSSDFKALDERMDKSDIRMDRLETKLDKSHGTLGDIRALLLGQKTKDELLQQETSKVVLC